MSKKTITNYIPEIYRDIFPSFFSKNIDTEMLADCNDCVMLPGKNGVSGQDYFSEETKCCTYFPYIPNYMAGLILSAKKFPEGKKIIRQMIAAGSGITPKGIMPGKKYLHLYELSRKKSFGKNASLKCPFYQSEKGMCAVWEGRGAVCSGFFCRHMRGADGENFWNAVKKYLQVSEQVLARYSIFFLDGIPENLPATPPDPWSWSVDELDEKKPDNYKEIWGKWEGKEEQFYIGAYELVKKLDRKKFESLMGIDHPYQLKKIEIAWKKMMKPQLPDIMKINPAASFRKKNENTWLASVPAGTFEIQQVVFDLLHYFDGKRKTPEVLKAIRKNLQVEPDRDLLEGFYQNRILI